MALRQFVDTNGTEWTVYDVVPRQDERRARERREAPAAGVDATEDRRGEDRRATLNPKVTRITRGWLCFEAATERRRLQPIPEKWHLLADADLGALLQQARVAPRRVNPGQGARAARS
jgi:hypothetical protein